MRGLLIAALVLLSGCVSPAPSRDDAVPEKPTTGHPGPSPTNGTVEAPTHPVGRTWIFRGVQQYNPESDITVVVAQADGAGYLFAGATEKDLVYEALWANPLYGRHDRALNRVDFERPWIKFPLWHGKSWPYSDTLTLTARLAVVETPQGAEDGFIIEGSDDRVTRRWDYAPSLGQMVRHVGTAADGTVFDDFRLDRVEEGTPALWYELGELYVVPGPEPAVFDVPSGFDNVIASAGGTSGGRARIQSPDGSSWSSDFGGAEEWRHGVLPAAPGRWIATVAGHPFLEDAPPVDWPIGWAHVNVAAVRWIRS